MQRGQGEVGGGGFWTVSAILDVRGLHKRFGRFEALKGIDLQVEAGEIFGFLGANGAGKTTFTKCVTGFLRPSAGAIHIAGVDAVRHRARALQSVGIVPDEYELYDDLTGYANMEYFASLYGFRGQDRIRRIRKVLKTVGMEEKARKKAKAFSHGMKQRICIAQALLHDPKIIILDEPTNGLDPRGAYELRELMKSLAADGTAIFLNSHIMSEVEQVCDRIAIVREGSIIAVGTPNELKGQVVGGQTTKVRLQSVSAAMVAAAKKVATVRKSGAKQLEVDGDDDAVSNVIAALVAQGGRIVAAVPDGSGLEDTFLAMTEDRK